MNPHEFHNKKHTNMGCLECKRNKFYFGQMNRHHELMQQAIKNGESVIKIDYE